MSTKIDKVTYFKLFSEVTTTDTKSAFNKLFTKCQGLNQYYLMCDGPQIGVVCVVHT